MNDKWPKIKQVLTSRLSDLTEELESPSLDDRQTTLIRGQILAIRETLSYELEGKPSSTISYI